MYYTLAPNLPANETCVRILGCTPPDRYFWRGNVLVVRFDGHLSMGHRFKSVEKATTEPVKEALRRIHESKGLERMHKEYESFSLRAESESMHKSVSYAIRLVDTTQSSYKVFRHMPMPSNLAPWKDGVRLSH